MQPVIGMLLIAAAAAFGGHGAQAQTYTVTIGTTGLTLGNVVSAASGDTEFDIAPATGTVTKLTGNGARLTTGTARATVTVNCGNQNACTSSNVNVRVGTNGSPTLRARALNEFAAAAGTATFTASPSGTNPISFQLGPIGKNASKTFYVGGDFPIAGDDSGLGTGAATSGFYVYVVKAPSTPTASISDTDTFRATVYRSLSMSKSSDLAFGRIVKPASGSGAVTVNATTGARTVAAAAGIGLSTPTPTRAVFTITGETGKVVAISIPTTVTMTGPSSATLTVTTSDTAPATQTLSSGTYTFGVGGTFTLASTTAGGAYSGTFNVTTNYN